MLHAIKIKLYYIYMIVYLSYVKIACMCVDYVVNALDILSHKKVEQSKT